MSYNEIYSSGILNVITLNSLNQNTSNSTMNSLTLKNTVNAVLTANSAGELLNNGVPVAPPASVPTLSNVLTAGNDATLQSITNVDDLKANSIHTSLIEQITGNLNPIYTVGNIDMQGGDLLNCGNLTSSSFVFNNYVQDSSYTYLESYLDSSISAINSEISIIQANSSGLQVEINTANLNILNNTTNIADIYIDLSGIAGDIIDLQYDVSGLAFIVGLDTSQIAMCSSLIFEIMYDFSSILPNVYETITSFNALDSSFMAFTSSQMSLDSSLNLSIIELQNNTSGIAVNINDLYIDISNIYFDLSSLQNQISLIELSGGAYLLDSSFVAYSSSQSAYDVSNTYLTSAITSSMSQINSEINTLYINSSSVALDLSNIATFSNGLASDVSGLALQTSVLFSDVSNIYMDLSNIASFSNGLASDVSGLANEINNITGSGIVASLEGLEGNVTMGFTYNGTAPTFSTSGNILFLNIPLAGATSNGLLSDSGQSINGNKGFIGNITFTSSTLFESLVLAQSLTCSGFLNVDSSAQILDILTVGSLNCSGSAIVSNGITSHNGNTFTGGNNLTGGNTLTGGNILNNITCSGFLNVDSSALILDLLTVGSITSSGTITSSSFNYQGTELATTLNNYELSSSALIFTSSAYVNSHYTSSAYVNNNYTSSAYVNSNYTSSSYVNNNYTSSAYINNNYASLSENNNFTSSEIIINNELTILYTGQFNLFTVPVGEMSALLFCNSSNTVMGSQTQCSYDFSNNYLQLGDPTNNCILISASGITTNNVNYDLTISPYNYPYYHNGNNVYITGASTGNGYNGGSVYISGGESSGGGNNGAVYINNLNITGNIGTPAPNPLLLQPATPYYANGQDVILAGGDSSHGFNCGNVFIYGGSATGATSGLVQIQNGYCLGSVLDISGSSYSIQNSDSIIIINDPTITTTTINLPTPSTAIGRQLMFITVAGDTLLTSVVFSGNVQDTTNYTWTTTGGHNLVMIYDGSYWRILSIN